MEFYDGTINILDIKNLMAEAFNNGTLYLKIVKVFKYIKGPNENDHVLDLLGTLYYHYILYK